MNGSFAEKLKAEVIGTKKIIHPVIKEYHEAIMKDRRIMECDSPGAGPRKSHKGKTSVSAYAKRTAVNSKKGLLLSNLVSFFKPQEIIELGTSLGMSTVYMAHACRSAQVITVEGNKQLAAISSHRFSEIELENIKVITGGFDDVLLDLKEHCHANTMVFIDGNHTYEATKKYVNAFSNAAIIVLDDIRWSAPMMKVWKEICANEDATKVDLFSIGILFPQREGKTSYAWI
jgi:predicted O-methyltransferase YrrM